MRKRTIFTILILLLIIIGGGIFADSRLRYGRNTLPPQYGSGSKTQSTTSPPFDHVVIILEENKPRESIIGNTAAPYINNLARTFSLATNYYAVTNPSLPNYIALTSGTTAGITNDCNPPGGSCMANVSNIADRLEQANKSWKAYAESMPMPCDSRNSGEYAVKHNPFMYYPDIASNTNRCNTHVVPLGQLASDLNTTDSLPNYAFVIPNLCNDMHDCPISTGDTWLAQQVPKILSSPAFTKQRSLLAITWDEGNNVNNNVPIIFAGSAAKQNHTSNTYYSHYSLLHTIENNWRLKPLTKNDASAPAMSDMLR